MNRKKDLPCGDLIHVRGSLYRVRRRYREGYSNIYYAKTICSRCGKTMFQAKCNSEYSPVCSKTCQYAGKPRKFSIKKPRSNGYHIQILAPNHPDADRHGRVYEHRIVAEKILGRKLKPQERVHHINMIKHDNRKENLFVADSDKAHFKLHGSLNALVSSLLQDRLISFDTKTGKYRREIWI